MKRCLFFMLCLQLVFQVFPQIASTYVYYDDGVIVKGYNARGNHYTLNKQTGVIDYENRKGDYYYNKVGKNYRYYIENHDSKNSGKHNTNDKQKNK